ncbi:MAG: hypothetical protein R6T93_09405 [Trueperaceae bacterium]
MKKYLTATLAMFVLGSFGVVYGQPFTSSANHEVTVTIPEVVTIRFTNGTSRAPVTSNVNLAFAPTADQASDGGDFQASNLASRGWDDVQVFQNRESTWSVSFAMIDPTEGFDWAAIAVNPSSADAIALAFDLGTPGEIAADTYDNANARGWNRLGFGPADFVLTLDGTETAGDYSATVVYTLTAP